MRIDQVGRCGVDDLLAEWDGAGEWDERDVRRLGEIAPEPVVDPDIGRLDLEAGGVGRW